MTKLYYENLHSIMFYFKPSYFIGGGGRPDSWWKCFVCTCLPHHLHKDQLGVVHKCQHFHKCTNHTLSGGGGGVLWKSIFLSYTFNFLAWFLLFSWAFLTLKKCWCVLFFGGVSESVWFVYSWKCLHLWMAP